MHTIRMTRDPKYGEPLTADVHPDEIENWRAAGFEAEGAAPHDAPRLNPLDHDGDGHSGGSVPGYCATATKGARNKAKRKAKK